MQKRERFCDTIMNLKEFAESKQINSYLVNSTFKSTLHKIWKDDEFEFTEISKRVYDVHSKKDIYRIVIVTDVQNKYTYSVQRISQETKVGEDIKIEEIPTVVGWIAILLMTKFTAEENRCNNGEGKECKGEKVAAC